MSSLLRSHAVLLIERSALEAVGPTPRVFGARVLRAEHVGIQAAVALAAPAFNSVVFDELDLDLVEPEELALPPPDFAAIEEAARVHGHNLGFQEGHAAGLAAADESMAESVRRLAVLASAVHEDHAAFFRAAERQVVDLALQIARKVIEREVENLPDLAVNVIRAALEEMDTRTAVRVRVSPHDAELLRRRWSQVVPSSIGADRIELQEDERIHSGGAIIETTHGQVDAQLETKLDQLGQALWTFVMDGNHVDQAGIAEHA